MPINRWQWCCAFCRAFNGLRQAACSRCGRDIEAEWSWLERNGMS